MFLYKNMNFFQFYTVISCFISWSRFKNKFLRKFMFLYNFYFIIIIIFCSFTQLEFEYHRQIFKQPLNFKVKTFFFKQYVKNSCLYCFMCLFFIGSLFLCKLLSLLIYVTLIEFLEILLKFVTVIVIDRSFWI